MLRKILFGLFFLLALEQGYAQDEAVDYHPKQLLKELLKLGITNQDSTIELTDKEGVVLTHLTGKYYKLHVNGQDRFYYLGRVNSCRAGGCSIDAPSSHTETYEYFDYFILFDVKGSVQLVKVFNYQATHGEEITSKGWLKQFIGYFGQEELLVGKNVDAIAGATISTYAITADVEFRTQQLKVVAGL